MTEGEDRDASRMESPPAIPAVSAVHLILPSDAEVWFLQVEAQFATRGITGQKTRFQYVVSSLSPEIATEVRDLLLRPPLDRPYVLKAELIKRTAASEQKKLQQLIGVEELGDRKPTQLLRRMQQLLGDRLSSSDSSSFLRELFLQRLPSNVRMVLASADSSTDLGKLAEMADKILEVAAPTLANVSDSSPNLPWSDLVPNSSNELQQLHNEVARLSTLVRSLTTLSRRRRPSGSANSRSSSPTTYPSQALGASPSGTLCWYHQKYGDQACHCRSPCSRFPCSRSLND